MHSVGCVCMHLPTGLKVDSSFCRFSYLLSQCKYRSLAPPLSCFELHSAFSSTRLVSFHSCASFCLQGCNVDIPKQLQQQTPTSQCGGLTLFDCCLWHVLSMRCWWPVSAYVCCICAMVSTEVQLPGPGTLVVVTSMCRGGVSSFLNPLHVTFHERSPLRTLLYSVAAAVYRWHFGDVVLHAG